MDGKPACDYRTVHESEGKLRITGKAVQEICGVDTMVINTDKVVLAIPFIFADEETVELFTKYMEALRKAHALNLPVIVVLDDCDPRLVACIGALREALKLVAPQTAFIVATSATLLIAYAESTKTYVHAESNEDKYFEYQQALEKVAHYLNILVKLLPTSRDGEVLLDVVRESIRGVVNVKETFNQVVSEILGFQLKFTEIYSIKGELVECPGNLLVVAKALQQRIEAEGKRAYILVPRQVKALLKNYLPEEFLVGV
ncbi:MAG: hypothetical protein QW229_03085 [Desulfurococcaceae archaeon]